MTSTPNELREIGDMDKHTGASLRERAASERARAYFAALNPKDTRA